MMRKFVGDKMSIEARSSDGGRRWDVQLFDRGHVTKVTGATTVELEKLAADRRMKPVAAGRI